MVGLAGTLLAVVGHTEEQSILTGSDVRIGSKTKLDGDKTANDLALIDGAFKT